MRKVHVSASDFTGQFLNINGNHTIELSALDVIRGIITIGYSDWRSTLSGGFHRYAEILYHAFGTIAYTQEVNGNLAIIKEFKSLDMSDKTPITYRLGMGITKLVAEKLLEVPWLLHVDELVSNGSATITTGTRERGDLAGLDIIDRWHVLEAKGRTSNPSNSIISKGKNQAGRIQTINGVTPITKSVCVSYIQENRTDTYLIDPEDGEDEIPTRWEINKELYIHNYYKRILRKTSHEGSSVDDITILGKKHRFRIFRLKNLPYKIGIYTPIYDGFIKDSIGFLDDLREFQEFMLTNKRENVTSMFNSIGLDGVAILE